MASSDPGTRTGVVDQLSPAQQLMQKHNTNGNHARNPSIEEVVDQDDLEHPPPSATIAHPPSFDQVPSSKAAGKQPEAASKPGDGRTSGLDTTSEELFPSLGGPKSASGPNTSSTWSKKPAVMSMGGRLNPASNASANAGRMSPGGMSSNGCVTSPGPTQPKMSLPGRYSEQVVFAPSQLLPRSQLKRPVGEVLRDINKRSKAEVKMTPGPNSCVIFEGTGPVDAVRQALKDLAKEVGSKQSTKVTIPASVRPHIIGKGGSTISRLSQRSGARIQVPRQEAADGPLEIDDDDDSAMVDVIIEGDAISAEMARRQIEEIVNERTSNLNLRMNDVPPEFYPFLAGPCLPGLEGLIGGRDVRLDIPRHHRHRRPKHLHTADKGIPGHAHNPIRIQGERQAALELRQALEQQVAELQQRLQSDQINIERGRHEFVMQDMDDVMNQTGCALIFPAEDDDDSETITLVGPPANMEAGMNKVMDIASSMNMTSIDIARQHPHAPRGAHQHARNVTRYLKRRNALKKLEQAHEARILANSTANAPTAWDVFSSDAKKGMRARTDIMNMVSAHPPERFAPVNIDPFYHQFLAETASQQIRDQQGVFVVMPDEQQDDDSEVLLVFEGGASDDYDVPREKPAPEDAQQYAQALQEAQTMIMAMCSGGENIIVQDLQAPAKFHEKIRRHAHKRHQTHHAGKIPVQLRVGADAAARRNLPHNDHISMRGPQPDVEDMMASVLAFIAQEESDELERGFTLSFEFPQQYANQLIGKGGSNIKKMKEEFDVDIQVNEGKVDITGPEAKAHACKAHIKALEKRLADEATHVLKIAPQFHKDLIGAKGSQVNRLQDRYNVRINFPRSGQTSEDGASTPTDVEAGGRRSNQPVDEVTVRGPKSGADAARSELLDLLQYVKDNSYEVSVSVPQNQLPKLIGANGRELEALRMATGAQIDIPKKTDNATGTDKVDVKISGTKNAVDEASKRIREAVKTFEKTISDEIDVAPEKHRLLIGRGGETRRQIESEYKVILDIPRQNVEGPARNLVKIKGEADNVERAKQHIVDITKDQEKKTIMIPSKVHHAIANNGQFFRDLNRDFKVRVDHAGHPLPAKPRSIVPTAVPANTINLPLITDENPDATSSSSRNLIHNLQKFNLFTSSGDPTSSATNTEANDNDDDIPWILTCPDPAMLPKAAARVETARDAESLNDTIGFLTLADPGLLRMVIGTGGQTINKLRKKHGARINVPGKKSGDVAVGGGPGQGHGHGQGQGQGQGQQQGGGGPGDAIEIVSTEDGVDGVVQAIMELVGGTVKQS